MPHDPKHFTILDPRSFDGDCFDVSERAVGQTASLLDLTIESIEGARLFARNAELERQLYRKEDPDATGWPDTAEGKRWARLEAVLEQAAAELQVLQRVASFNPRNT